MRSLCLCVSVVKRFLEPSCGHAQEAAVSGGLNRHAQQLVRTIFERYEAEWLEDASLPFADRVQHLRHAFDAAGLSLKRNLDEIAGGERPRQLQQASIDGNDVDVALGLLAVSELNDYRRGC